VDALAIVEATLTITSDRDLYDRLAHGARAFFEDHLSWTASAATLMSFYENRT